MEHQKRVITAVVLVSLAGLAYYFFRGLALQIMVGAASLLAYHEFLGMLLDKRLPANLRNAKSILALVFALFCITHYSGRLWTFAPVATGGLFFFATALWYTHKRTDLEIELAQSAHLKDAFVQWVGLIYIPGFLSFVMPIHNDFDAGPTEIIGLLLIIWACDIGAYYGGRFFGKHPLSPRLSPKKTLEGAFCGILASIAVAALFRHFFMPWSSGIFTLVFGTSIVAIASQMGDLIESLVKRVAGQKDSGTIFPGHGGAFDRFDSLIFAAPVYYYLTHF